MEYYSVVKKMKIQPFMTLMDLENIQCEIRQKNMISLMGCAAESSKWINKTSKNSDYSKFQYGGYQRGKE